MEKTLLIFGSKGIAIEIAELAQEFYNSEFNKIQFVIGDDEAKFKPNQIFDSELGSFVSSNACSFIISMTKHSIRSKIEEQMTSLQVDATNIIHPTAVISASSKIGKGNYIATNTVISSNTKIGNHNIINFNTTIGHDAILNNHIIINPAVCISGNATIGNRVLIGANSFIFQGKKIGKDTLIDAMTYIDRNIDNRMLCSSRQLDVYKRIL